MKGFGWQGLEYNKNDISFNKKAKRNPLTKRGENIDNKKTSKWWISLSLNRKHFWQLWKNPIKYGYSLRWDIIRIKTLIEIELADIVWEWNTSPKHKGDKFD